MKEYDLIVVGGIFPRAAAACAELLVRETYPGQQ